MARRIIGAVLFVFGLWLLWGPVQAAMLYVNRGAPVGAALADPVFILPALRGLLAALAGALVLSAMRFGPWLAGAAAVVSLVIGGAVLAAGAEAMLWRPHFVHAAILAAWTAALISIPREPVST
ncbi:MAG: hypothetical protein AAFR94_04455 [Pseudomonadota bacterium]